MRLDKVEKWSKLLGENEFDIEKSDLVRLDTESPNARFLTPADAFNAKSSSIASLRKYLGEDAKAIIWQWFLPVLNSINVGRGMNQESIGDFIDFIFKEYYFLNCEEVKNFFYMAKTGKLGPVYDRLDMQTLCIWLSEYDNLRTSVAVAASESNKEQQLNDAVEMPPEVKALIEKLNPTAHKPKCRPIPTLAQYSELETTIRNYNFMVTNADYSSDYETYCEEKHAQLYKSERV